MLSGDLIKGTKAAAAYLGFTERQLWHMVYEGRVPHVRKGRRLFFRKTELDRAFSGAA